MIDKKIKLLIGLFKDTIKELTDVKKMQISNEEKDKEIKEILKHFKRDITFMDKSMTLAQKLLDEKDTENE